MHLPLELSRMKRKGGLMLCLVAGMALLAQAPPTPRKFNPHANLRQRPAPTVVETEKEKHGIMRMDPESMRQAYLEHFMLPKAPMDHVLESQLHHLSRAFVGQNYSVLPYLTYTVTDRNQMNCGNCWVWTGTALAEVQMASQFETKDRFSIQYFDSCSLTWKKACQGGNISQFTSWYLTVKNFVPWSNAGAHFQDKAGTTTATCESVTKTPNYPFTSIAAQVVDTTSVSQDQAIAAIKNILHQKKAVWMSYYLDDPVWDEFYSYWDNQDETVLWDPDKYHGTTASEIGGHAVTVVGYDDTNTDPTKHYWIVLNSWGKNAGRPTGLFRMPMRMNYKNTLKYGGFDYYAYMFRALDVQVAAPSPNLLKNWNFESGEKDWTTFAEGMIWEESVDYITPMSGKYILWIGTWDEPTEDFGYQDVTIPSGTASASLTFNMAIMNSYTVSPPDDEIVNTFAVKVKKPGGETLETLMTASNVDADYFTKANNKYEAAWQKYGPYDLSKYAGQTVRISFESKQPDTAPTAFFIDDVAITTAGPAGFSITQQPTSQVVQPGASVTFSVGVSGGTAPYKYQWQKNGTNVGTDTATFAIPSVALGDAGDYKVIVTDSASPAASITSATATLTVLSAPVITTQPANQTVKEGENATFSVVAVGTNPLTYQWQFRGADVAGATSASYTRQAVGMGDNGGSALVKISNSQGNVTSNPAVLTVTPSSFAPEITTQPADQTVTEGQTATFNVVATGNPAPIYEWKKNGTPITGLPLTATSYTTPTTVLADNGNKYTVTVSNSIGEVTSRQALLTVKDSRVPPTITTQPADKTVEIGQTASFTVVATGTPAPTFQWKKNGTDLGGATQATYTTGAAVMADNGSKYSVVATNAVGTVTSREALLTVMEEMIAPTFTTHPQSATKEEGQSVSFTADATGTPTPIFQWRKNATNITGAVSKIYTIPSIALADSGAIFTCMATNAAGSATSNPATLTVTPKPVPPAITTQPKSVSVTEGQTASFNVVATGTPAPEYQWKKNGVVIAGATATAYTTPATTLADSGTQFTVAVFNVGGSVESSPAVLTVTPPVIAPAITAHPVSRGAMAGQTTSFSITATGTAPLVYQWLKNGTPIASATAASFTTPALVAGDNGAKFKATVSNAAGTATSNEASLKINTTNFDGSTVTDGNSMALIANAWGGTDLNFDLNGDGKVDDTDLTLFLGNYGK